MLHKAVYERLVSKCPQAVMVRAALENALPPALVDEVFERVASRQYTRKLLFSTLVRLLSLVVCKVRPSVHAATQALDGELSVNAKSIYNKLNGTETAVTEALVRESARRMAELVDRMQAPLAPLLPGYQAWILDGNHLAATEHRLKELRSIGGGPLPGLALVVYDANRGLIHKTYLCEDGHAQERQPLIELLGEIEPGGVWIADRNFATTAFLWQVQTAQAFFIVRRHGQNGLVREAAPWRNVAEGPSGPIDERPIVVEDDFGGRFAARSIRVRLATATRDGDRQLELLTNLPAAVSAETIAAAYRGRWRIETTFAELDRVFEGEIESLAHPRAALLAFSLALVAYNALSVVQAALRSVHGEAKVRDDVSSYYLGLSTASAWDAMDLLSEPAAWTRQFARLAPARLADVLIDLARQVNLAKLKKHRRGPKKPPPKRRSSTRQPHVSTARILAQRKRG